ncbi:unnamed protein product [Phytophthora lilii]|uniref:Unnamed protein product n=1 Tax=Phytophthora lilii TaxID=2077276 RepID=A0A9W6TIJ0_9STRA|nr:unnamed protein product [Phytophthora lilii]
MYMCGGRPHPKSTDKYEVDAALLFHLAAVAPAVAARLGALIAARELAQALATVAPAHTVLAGRVEAALHGAALASAVADAQPEAHGVLGAAGLGAAQAAPVGDAEAAGLGALVAVGHAAELGVAGALGLVGALAAGGATERRQDLAALLLLGQLAHGRVGQQTVELLLRLARRGRRRVLELLVQVHAVLLHGAEALGAARTGVAVDHDADGRQTGEALLLERRHLRAEYVAHAHEAGRPLGGGGGRDGGGGGARHGEQTRQPHEAALGVGRGGRGVHGRRRRLLPHVGAERELQGREDGLHA